jgi:ADP-heptose:LPS heptosyltransferase
LTVQEREKAAQVLAPLGQRPLLVCGVGTKMQAKDWGLSSWEALIRRLSAAYPGFGLVMVGAKEDHPESAEAARHWQGLSVNVCGELKPREAAAVIARGRVFLGPDSGPMHFAAATGVPAVIAFSARGKPGIWFPAGGQHHVLYRRTDCFGCNLETCTEQRKKCLQMITVDDMFSAVRQVLGAEDEASSDTASDTVELVA